MRAPWLIEICELYGLHILNGIQPGPIACNTFHRGNDSSCIDLILSNTPTAAMECDPDTLKGLSDHTIITTTVQNSFFTRNTTETNTRDTEVKYKWVEGTGVSSYAKSANIWQEHTQTVEFNRGLLEIVN
jgi:hypothetical protein